MTRQRTPRIRLAALVAAGMFRKAWDAAAEADKEGQRKLQEEIHQQEAKSGGSSMLLGRSSLRSEVLRLAARRDRVLGEEFLAKLKVEKQQEATDGNDRNRRNPFDPPEPVRQRLSLARELLIKDVERAIQFADPVLDSASIGESVSVCRSALQECGSNAVGH